jgi:hypothetical protein
MACKIAGRIRIRPLTRHHKAKGDLGSPWSDLIVSGPNTASTARTAYIRMVREIRRNPPVIQQISHFNDLLDNSAENSHFRAVN